jgi:predicted phosphoribosyltransferase
MKSRKASSTEYATFEDALKAVVSVPRDELKRREEAYQRDRAPQKKKRAKTSPASHASNEKD